MHSPLKSSIICQQNWQENLATPEVVVEKNMSSSNKRHASQSWVDILTYIYKYAKHIYGARGSVVVKALCYKPEGSGFETRWGEWMFSIY
jgi:hypothetical protein